MDMASFETTHGNPLGEAVREWRPGRFVPLYAAGILIGATLGIGLGAWPGGATPVREHTAVAPIAPAAQNTVIDDAPTFAFPAVVPATVEFAVDPADPFREAGDPFLAVVIEQPAVVPVPEAPVAPVQAPAPIVVAAAPPVAVAPPAPAPAVPAPAPIVEPAAPPSPAAPAVEAKPNFYVPAVSGGPATGMELQLLGLINAERANAGLAPYALDGGLTTIARTRSQQLIDQNYFAHRDPYGYSMYVELLAHFGYTSYAWAGENLAMNNWPADTAANEAIRGLMNSPTHRANILAGDFSRIGVGEIASADGRHFFTMIFLS